MSDFTNITMLYVDDEDVNLFIFNANFKDKFNLLTSQSPAKALDLIEEEGNDITIVISDMHMPVMNGIEFIKKAREKRSDIHYYILSGFAYNKEIDEAVEQKIVEKFLTKPFDVDEINDIVKKLADN